MRYVQFVFVFATAMKPVEIQEKLQLTKFKERDWYVQPSCATEGDGLYEGLSWLSQTHSGGGKKK